MKTKWSRIITLLVLVLLLGFAGARFQQLQDWWKLRGYTAPPPVVQLASDDTMNSYTRHLFYLNKPQLLSTVDSFRQHCPENEDTIVLGCYHPDQSGIYVYNVQDQSLAGIQQVTAAHEVLHAVYARLSGSARTQLDNELEDYYKHGLTNATVKGEVALYQKTEPNSVYDEMSCTFGTEIANLPTALTNYYAQFFTNRQKIVDYEQQYQGQFNSREQQITADDTQLATMKQHINTQKAALTAQSNALNAQRTQLQQTLSSGQVAKYNGAVDGYNMAVNSYNTSLTELKQNIADYNQLVAARNAIAGQLTTLDSAIDTRLSTASSQ